jgi:dihydroorotase
MSILIENARVIDPASGFDAVAPVCIQGSEILALGEIPAGFEPRRRIDARGRWLFPGLVDLSAHLREPGEEHKATIASETLAAARGGVTTVVVPPDTDPPIDSPAEVELISRRAEQACGVRVRTMGALTRRLRGEQLAELAALKRAGVVAVSNAQRPLASALVLRRALEYAATFDLMVALSAQDAALAGSGCVHEGAVSTRLGLAGIPEAAETAALGTILALVEQTGARVHVNRLSTRRGAEMVAKARADGLPVSADVAAHQLFLTEMDAADFNALCHVIPPLRTQRDREGLREAVARGEITAICSDHQPHESDSKLGPFAETRPGISALETLLPLTLRLVEEGVLSLPEALARVTSGPATILGLGSGRLVPGSPADFVLFDPEGLTELTPETWLSAGTNSPFLGWSFSGRVTETWVAGRPAWTLPIEDAA